MILDVIAATFLASVGAAYGYMNFPLFEPLRKLVAKYISPKLNECIICATFWISLLVFTPLFLFLNTLAFVTIALPFACAGLATIVAHLFSH